ncbi:hypothetical protein GR7B_00149 [Vibrio phage vB_VcorM_GR7B]|nr:hypothetical protein GR7B_00149 [Vibrio phage vB_VcorM_GR7B]
MAGNTSSTILDPTTVSRLSIQQQLDTFLAGTADADKWKDYFALGAGTTIKELLAVIGAFLKYNSLTALRENSILTAKLKSVIYGIADTLGYPINRSLAPRFKLGINVTVATYWDRTTPLGYINGQAISLETSQLIPVGAQTLNVVLGNWVTSSKVVDNGADFASIDFALADIDLVDNELLEVYVNSSPAANSRNAEDIYTGSLIIKTLIDSLSLLSGNALIGRNIGVGDTVEIRYLQLDANQLTDTSTYVVGNVNLANSGMTATTLEVVRPYAQPDSLDKIVALAPAYHSTARRMVTIADHIAIVKSYVGMRDASWHGGLCSDETYRTQATCEAAGETWTSGKVGCCLVGMSYLFEDEHHFGSDEEVTMLDYLENYRLPPGGILFRDPEPVLVHPEITIVIQTGADTSAIETSIKNYIATITHKLSGRFIVGDLSKHIDTISGVVRKYIQKPTADNQLVFYKYFKLGNLSLNFVDETSLNSLGDGSDSGYS